jgi:hypothetical protein
VARFANADSMLTRYQRNYDSLVTYIDARSKAEMARLNLYKSSLRALAKYRQPGYNGPARAEYTRLRKDFDNDASLYAAHLKEYKQTVAHYGGVFQALAKHYKVENKIADYMAQAEDKRKKQEEGLLTRKASLNKRENKIQQESIERSMKRTKRLAA